MGEGEKERGKGEGGGKSTGGKVGLAREEGRREGGKKQRWEISPAHVRPR